MLSFRPETLPIERPWNSYHTPKLSAKRNVFFLGYHILNLYSSFRKDPGEPSFIVTLLFQEENIHLAKIFGV
jgi:hypothetical protein